MVKNWESAEQINARLREVTAEVRKMRNDLTPRSEADEAAKRPSRKTLRGTMKANKKR